MSNINRIDNFMAQLNLDTYRVGGSVRDELLGRPIKDADYVVFGTALSRLGTLLDRVAEKGNWPDYSRTPLQIRGSKQTLGWRIHAKGLGQVEIMLPRVDEAIPFTPEQVFGNAHQSFEIVVDQNLTMLEDAERRDFTFNALYLPVEKAIRLDGGLMPRPKGLDVEDPTGRGLFDLAHKLVSTTHENSFKDDPLRTLRALRFVSTLGYDLSTNAYMQMVRYADRVDGLSDNGFASGTVLSELSRLLMGAQPVKALRIARDTGVLGTLLPELEPMLGFDQASRYHDLTTDEHTFKALETAANVDAPLRVRMALLFHDSGKPDAAWMDDRGRKHYYANPKDKSSKDHEVYSESRWLKAANRLGATRELRREVATLVRWHMVAIEKPKGSRVGRMRVQFGDDMLRDLFLHRMCDLSGKGMKKSDFERMDNIAKMEEIRASLQERGVPCSVGELEIRGGDLLGLGHAPGRGVGDALTTILDEVVCQPNELKLSREWQLKRAEELA